MHVIVKGLVLILGSGFTGAYCITKNNNEIKAELLGPVIQ